MKIRIMLSCGRLFTGTHWVFVWVSSFPYCLSRDQEIFLWWPISRSIRDKEQSVMGRQQWSVGPQPPLASLCCVCVCELGSLSEPIVSCKLRAGGVAGNRQRQRRCAASGGSVLWRWPKHLFLLTSSSSSGWGPLLSALTLGGCVSLCAIPLLSCIDLEIAGS